MGVAVGVLSPNSTPAPLYSWMPATGTTYPLFQFCSRLTQDCMGLSWTPFVPTAAHVKGDSYPRFSLKMVPLFAR